MSEVIRFPSAEKLLVATLKPILGMPVVTKVPNPRPGTFVRLKKVGGTRRDIVTDSPMVVVECWAPTGPEADDLSQLVRGHIFALAPDTVRKVREIAGPQDFPDPISEHPRYQFTVQLYTRGTAL